jgi:hypothetical protein
MKCPPVCEFLERLQKLREPEQRLQALRLQHLLGENGPHRQDRVVLWEGLSETLGRVHTARPPEEPPDGRLDGHPEEEDGSGVRLHTSDADVSIAWQFEATALE